MPWEALILPLIMGPSDPVHCHVNPSSYSLPWKPQIPLLTMGIIPSAAPLLDETLHPCRQSSSFSAAFGCEPLQAPPALCRVEQGCALECRAVPCSALLCNVAEYRCSALLYHALEHSTMLCSGQLHSGTFLAASGGCQTRRSSDELGRQPS